MSEGSVILTSEVDATYDQTAGYYLKRPVWVGEAQPQDKPLSARELTKEVMSYTLANERAENGVHVRRGTLRSGARTRLSDSGSVYLEDRYQHTNSEYRHFGSEGCLWAHHWLRNQESRRQLYDQDAVWEESRHREGTRLTVLLVLTTI